MSVGCVLGTEVLVGDDALVGSKDWSDCSVEVASKVAVGLEVAVSSVIVVEVKVAVANWVGVDVNVAVFVGVETAATNTNSNGRSSNGSDASVMNLSMNSPDAKSEFVPRIPTKLLTGTLRVSSNNEDNCAATTWSDLATFKIPDAALES